MNTSALRTVEDFITVLNFIGSDISSSASERIMQRAKNVLSIEEMEVVANNCPDSDFYTHIMQYDAEMGGLSRY